jgi:hypothetical protein
LESKLLKNPHAVVGLHTVKKGLPFSRPPSPAGDGKLLTFFTVHVTAGVLIGVVKPAVAAASVHFFLVFLVFSHLSGVLYGSDKNCLMT